MSIVYYFLWRAAKSNGIWCITVANFSKRAGVVHDKELRDQNVSFTGWCGWGAVTNRREAWRASEVRVLRGWHVREKGSSCPGFAGLGVFIYNGWNWLCMTHHWQIHSLLWIRLINSFTLPSGKPLLTTINHFNPINQQQIKYNINNNMMM